MSARWGAPNDPPPLTYTKAKVSVRAVLAYLGLVRPSRKGT